MSVDEPLRTYRPPAAEVDVEQPLATVRRRFRRRRLVRRTSVGTAVVAAIGGAFVLLSVVSVGHTQPAPRVVAGATGPRVRVADRPAGYGLTADSVVHPESPHIGNDGNVSALYTGSGPSLVVVSRRVPGGVPDTSVPVGDVTVQGRPGQLARAGDGQGEVRVWVPDLDGYEATFQGRGLSAGEVLALAEQVRPVGSHLQLPALPAWADQLQVSPFHPVDIGAITVREVVFAKGRRHLTLRISDEAGSTALAHWRSGGRAVSDLGDPAPAGGALLLGVGRERRIGWTRGTQAFALGTDDPSIDDDELIAIARSVSVS